MKKRLIFKAGYIIFTILCLSLCGLFPDNAMLFFRIWYAATIIAWCALAVDLLSISFRRAKRKHKSRSGKEKKK